MKSIPPSEFYAWCGSRGIEPDLRYDEPRCLVYVPYRGFDRFWDVPEHRDNCSSFVAHILAKMAPWSRCMAWIRGGYWPSDDRISIRRTAEHLGFPEGAGIPFGAECALEFEYSERSKLVDVATAQLLWGWCVYDDLFLIPDHGSMVVQTEHHHVVHVSFDKQEQIEGFVQHMASGGYLLPDELPDDTFKQPSWMK